MKYNLYITVAVGRLEVFRKSNLSSAPPVVPAVSYLDLVHVAREESQVRWKARFVIDAVQHVDVRVEELLAHAVARVLVRQLPQRAELEKVQDGARDASDEHTEFGLVWFFKKREY